MENLDSGCYEITERLGHDFVEMSSSLAAAEHQHHRTFFGKSPVVSGLSAKRAAIQMCNRRAERQPHVSGMGEHTVVDNPDMRSQASTQPVRKSGTGIGLVDDQRGSGSACGQVSGDRRVTSESDNDVGPRSSNVRTRSAHGRDGMEGEPQSRSVDPTRERIGARLNERIPTLRNQVGLESARSTDEGDGRGRRHAHQGICCVQRWFEMTSRSACGEDNMHTSYAYRRRSA